jgi:hypothetical protein
MKRMSERKNDRLTDDMKITVLKKENTFRPKSAIFKRVAHVLACNGKTVATARKGEDSAIVRLLVNRKMIRVEAPKA